MRIKRFGVIDLGTNTFHLLIVESRNESHFQEIVRKRIVVKLAEDGIQKIGNQPFDRGIKAIENFKEILDNHQITAVHAYGTAALRTAENSQEFVNKIQITTGINIQIIDGLTEASLIYKGVRLSIPMQKSKPYLIMDVGGGSVEFILCNESEIIWANSYPIGVMVLFHEFHNSDPISDNDQKRFNTYLNEHLVELKLILSKYPIDSFIGASGTFDVLEIALEGEKQSNNIHSIVPIHNFNEFHKLVVETDLAKRLAIDVIPNTRAELIVGAMILIKYVLDLSKAKNIITSSYSLKEGVISDKLKIT